jgi:hypothetical protein
MADSDQLLQPNKDLEATCAHEEARIMARRQVFVITCLDPRAGPRRPARRAQRSRGLA